MNGIGVNASRAEHASERAPRGYLQGIKDKLRQVVWTSIGVVSVVKVLSIVAKWRQQGVKTQQEQLVNRFVEDLTKATPPSSRLRSACQFLMGFSLGCVTMSYLIMNCGRSAPCRETRAPASSEEGS